MRKVAIFLAAVSSMIAVPAAAEVYVGGLVGYDNIGASNEFGDGSEGDVMYGVTAGYDFNIGKGFFGIEGEYSDSSLGLEAEDVLEDGDMATISAGRDLYVGVRSGFNLAGGAKAYVKAGYVNSALKGTYFDGLTTESEEIDSGGWRVGAGAEVGIGPAAIRGEYRYSNSGELDYLGEGTGIRVDRHQFVLGLLAKI